ncbi:MAG TPA: tetratricopeptide repeat protein [Thermoanaerobaculia bacterium]
MKKSTILILLAAAIALAGCATPADVPPPVVIPSGEATFLIDPRTGQGPAPSAEIAQQFDTAWRWFLAGNMEEASRRLAEIRGVAPNYAPAALAEIAVDIREGRYEEARLALNEQEPSTVARVYAAEIAIAEKQTRRAYELYREVVQLSDAPPSARQRLTELESQLFQELYAAALAAKDEEAARLLREALALQPAANAARVLLVQKLVEQKRWDEARTALDPLLSSGEVDRNEVQEALAEIDAGRGRYQEAIVRYERLARRASEPRYQRRLDEIKELWSAANMPPQFRRALESDAATRADFAVLLYWKVNSVRFAQNLRTPPIAIDVGDVAGREEIIRAMAIGLYDVDPVTRRVGPGRQITATALGRLAARVLTLRGATCAQNTTDVLTACKIPTVVTETPETPVTGHDVARVLDAVNRSL